MNRHNSQNKTLHSTSNIHHVSDFIPPNWTSMTFRDMMTANLQRGKNDKDLHTLMLFFHELGCSHIERNCLGRFLTDWSVSRWHNKSQSSSLNTKKMFLFFYFTSLSRGCIRAGFMKEKDIMTSHNSKRYTTWLLLKTNIAIIDS